MKWEHNLLARLVKSQNTTNCEAKCNRLQMCLFIKCCSLKLKHVELTIWKIYKTHANWTEYRQKHKNGNGGKCWYEHSSSSATQQQIMRPGKTNSCCYDNFRYFATATAAASTYCIYFRVSLWMMPKMAPIHWIFC